jgi:hypothetical protein
MIKFKRLRKASNNMTVFGPSYMFRDAKCLGRTCFRPEERLIPKTRKLYGNNLSSKPRRSWVCGHCKDFGCPLVESYTQELQKERIEDGWQSAKPV